MENGENFRRSFSCNAGKFVHNRQNGPDIEKRNSGSTISFLAGDALERDREYFDARSKWFRLR